MIAVCDDTYVDHQKSANFPFQRASYLPHKYRNLFKPMVIIATDGCILEVTGPYEASKNDSSIMSELRRSDSSKKI
uniref:DDE Tnp4 domain-containing protein n=1 Tax=Tetranychus urticae TaxID=32264 RepID=T1JRE4_TETUR